MNEITEKWARRAPAGAELDRVCAEWMGTVTQYRVDGSSIKLWHRYNTEHLFGNHRRYWPKHSTGWAAAAPLLEAIKKALPAVSLTNDETVSGDEWTCWVRVSVDPGTQFAVTAPTPQLAIARACAVLVARGITREDLGDK